MVFLFWTEVQLHISILETKEATIHDFAADLDNIAFPLFIQGPNVIIQSFMVLLSNVACPRDLTTFDCNLVLTQNRDEQARYGQIMKDGLKVTYSYSDGTDSGATYKQLSSWY